MNEVDQLDGPATPQWVRELIGAWNRGDREAVLAHLSDEIVVDSPGVAGEPGRVSLPPGKAAFRESFQLFRERRPTFELVSVLASDVSASLVLLDNDGRNLTLLLALDDGGKVRQITVYRPG